MQLHYTGKNIEVTTALKTFTAEKFKPLEKRYSHITNVYVVFIVEKNDQIAEATVHANGAEIHATAKSEDMYQSIEALAHKLLGQITKHKEKESEHQR
jgi:putative sigma-54 modulation protein